jgi:hypothetical protein
MEPLLGEGAGLTDDHAETEAAVQAPEPFAAGVSGLSVYETSFPR